MWSKLYLAVLGLSVAVMAFFTFYSWSWLRSIGLPAAAAAGYEYHSDLSWPILWITTVVLLMLGNALLWTTGRAWALWAAFSYFTIFVAARYFWLDPAFADFNRGNALVDQSGAGAPFVAVLMIVFMALVIFTDQFVVIRMRARAYPEPPLIADAGPEIKSEDQERDL
jgi:hypothetical protein